MRVPRHAVLEFIGGPTDGRVVGLPDTARPTHHIDGYYQPTPATDLDGQPMPGRWHAHWQVMHPADGRPEPYCTGTWVDDRGGVNVCGPGCPRWRKATP
jgi:hypothetical protein